jgi:hypothetical protein
MNTQQTNQNGQTGTVAPPFIKKPFASSILLCVRTDQPRQIEKRLGHYIGNNMKEKIL